MACYNLKVYTQFELSGYFSVQSANANWKQQHRDFMISNFGTFGMDEIYQVFILS